MKWVALLCLCACSSAREEPRFCRAKDHVVTDDGAETLQRGFGVQVVETRGDHGRTSEGHWLAMNKLEPFAPAQTAPAPLRAFNPITTRDRWIDVDTTKEIVTAYEGETPVRAFYASTGVAPYSTPLGIYRIYAKLRSATMAAPRGTASPFAGNEGQSPNVVPEDPHPYRFEAVPDVQYFNREVALHGAYWHRRFGERVSHGCVNLALDDARWLFEFTNPSLLPSEREHAGAGTVVRVR